MRQIEQRAIEVFGDQAKARRWLSKPKEGLRGLSPLSAAATTGGAEQVREILERIASGYFA